MRALRILLALVILLAAIVPSGLLYAEAKDGNVWNWGLWGALFIAALLAAASFLFTRRKLPGSLLSLVVGALLTYVVWIGVLLALAPSGGLMWLPIIVLVGIPYTAPIIAGAWFASGIFLAAFAKPNNALQQTSENERG